MTFLTYLRISLVINRDKICVAPTQKKKEETQPGECYREKTEKTLKQSDFIQTKLTNIT